VKALVLLFAALVSCGASQLSRYETASQAAERDYSSGRYRAAAEQWLAAARQAEDERDRQEAEYRAAASYERGALPEEAMKIYVALAKTQGERAARAALAAAELERRSGHEDRAQALYLRALRAHPESGPAEGALREHLEYIERGGGDTATLAAVERLIGEFDGTPLDERLRYERARRLDTLERTAEARDAYLDTARRHAYPEGALWDDALYRAAACEEKLGRPREAIAILESMLAEREEAHLSGSYERSRYAEARFKIAELYRDALHDPARARLEFRRVWNEHPTTLLRDDALFEEALIARASGDAAAVCQVLTLLLEGANDSRYASCVSELCPALAAPQGRPCRDYVRARWKAGERAP
jgi:hypothetical protein